MGTVSPGALRVMQVMECTIGGTRRHLTDVARGLRERGVEVHLVVAAERQPAFRESLRELQTLGCLVHEIPMSRGIAPLQDMRQIAQLKKILRVIQPDIVHTHSSKAGVIGRLASLRTGIGKRVHTPHTFAFLFHEMFGPLKRALFYRIEKHLAGSTHALIAVSPGEAQTFESSGIVSSEKIQVVQNGIDPEPFVAARPANLVELGLDPERPIAAVVGLLNIAKGQDLALQALASPAISKDLQLMVVGHGETLGELKSLARSLGVEERVAFLGFREDVPELLAASDFLLLPSRWEGMPYIVIEAMAAGLPVVATPVDGARDLVQPNKTGVLAADSTSDAIAKALEHFMGLSSSEQKSMGELGRQRALKSFTRDTMVDELCELYRAMLQRD
ncbi:MAG: glycosyltransferase involved in cell wall biosynthesis [Planctomycetota bacterium]|jgi:glycosyltransferase involved in cell wall biosynthesis